MKIYAPIFIVGKPNVGRKTVQDVVFGKNGILTLAEQQEDLNLHLTTIISEIQTIPENAFGVVMVYDITNKDSYDFCEQVCKALSQNLMIKAIVGTHRDQSAKRQITYQTAVDLKDSIDGLWGEIGLKDTTNILQITNKIKIRSLFSVKEFLEQKPHIQKLPESYLQNRADPRITQEQANMICEFVPDSEFDAAYQKKNAKSKPADLPKPKAEKKSMEDSHDFSQNYSSRHESQADSKSKQDLEKSKAHSVMGKNPEELEQSVQQPQQKQSMAQYDSKPPMNPKQTFSAQNNTSQTITAQTTNHGMQASLNQSQLNQSLNETFQSINADESILEEKPPRAKIQLKSPQLISPDHKSLISFQTQLSPDYMQKVRTHPNLNQSQLTDNSNFKYTVLDPEADSENSLEKQFENYFEEFDYEEIQLQASSSRIVNKFAPEIAKPVVKKQFVNTDLNPNLVQALNVDKLVPSKILIAEGRKKIQEEKLVPKVKIPLQSMIAKRDEQRKSVVKESRIPSVGMRESITASKQQFRSTSKGKQMSQGVAKKPDFVLELDIHDQEYRLPVCVNDNAYEVAKNFVTENGLELTKIKDISMLVMDRITLVQQSMLNTKKKSKVLFKFEIEIEDKIYTIQYRADDEPADIAERFCEEMQLDKSIYLMFIYKKIEEAVELFHEQQQ
ncbi:Ras_domain-containing protein [Hexamita inflata]|uniref:Ras domain-containing protein n=1 Tax=Hexamita inflata TaxID=28002 RepID=A0AA86UIP9_9EUKA|nr:Ras domain-containing protein [Hexamita inflata]